MGKPGDRPPYSFSFAIIISLRPLRADKKCIRRQQRGVRVEPHLGSNVRKRRISLVTGRSGEGPFAIRFADLRHGVSRATTYALASRLRASSIEARVTRWLGFRRGSRSPWRDADCGRTRKRCAHHPAARQDDKALHVVAPFDDLHAQHRHLCHRSVNLPAL